MSLAPRVGPSPIAANLVVPSGSSWEFLWAGAADQAGRAITSSYAPPKAGDPALPPATRILSCLSRVGYPRHPLHGLPPTRRHPLRFGALDLPTRAR